MTKDQKPWPQVGDETMNRLYREYHQACMYTTRPPSFDNWLRSYNEPADDRTEKGFCKAMVSLSDTIAKLRCELAKYQTKRQRLITRYLAVIKKHNEGWMPDFTKGDGGCLHVYDQYHNAAHGEPEEEGVLSTIEVTTYQTKPKEWYIKRYTLTATAFDGGSTPDRPVHLRRKLIPDMVAAEFTDAEMKLILTGKE